MAVGHQAAALASVEINGSEAIQQRDQFGTCTTSPAAGNHQNAACRPEKVDRTRNLRGVREQQRARFGAEMLFEMQSLGYDASQRVNREIDKGRPGFATLPERARDRLVEFLEH